MVGNGPIESYEVVRRYIQGMGIVYFVNRYKFINDMYKLVETNFFFSKEKDAYRTIETILFLKGIFFSKDIKNDRLEEKKPIDKDLYNFINQKFETK